MDSNRKTWADAENQPPEALNAEGRPVWVLPKGGELTTFGRRTKEKRDVSKGKKAQIGRETRWSLSERRAALPDWSRNQTE